jgi:antirestriction protein
MDAGWDDKLSDDVIRECARNGAVVTHIAVDRQSLQGNVYVKCENATGAVTACTALHGRLFNGRLITVGYVPSDVYHSLFPGAGSNPPTLGI